METDMVSLLIQKVVLTRPGEPYQNHGHHANTSVPSVLTSDTGI
jgi:hypothetical protein